MPKKLDNEQVALVLENIAEMLDLLNENIYKIRAYQRAANSIRTLPDDIKKVASEGRLTEIPGVGKDIAARIDELLTTGVMAYFDELKGRVPYGVLEMMQIQGVGPKKAKEFFETLNITTVDQLAAAAEKHKIAALPRMGPKIEENILEGIAEFRQSRDRLTLAQGYPLAEHFTALLLEHRGVLHASPAGSLRRMKETIGDIDILAAADDPEAVMEYFCGLDEVARVLGRGLKKSSIVTVAGIQVDLRVIPPDQYGSALQYFTGSKPHNIHLRDIAKRRGLKISEYGIFDAAMDKRLGGATEDEIYANMGMDTPPPTLREDHGEIEAALAHTLPAVVELSDIQGDLQVHSTWSDGLSHIRELREEAKRLGYSYMAITDHALKLHIAGGMTLDEIGRRAKEIDSLNEQDGDFRILNGVEVNIDNDGNVDYDDKVMASFDIVVASLHSGFKQDEKRLTDRMIKAMHNPHVDIIAHPTGRIIGVRPPYALDIEKVLEAALNTGTIIEVNAFPNRLDLKDDYVRRAIDRNVRLSIDTDAHQAAHLRYMLYGVATAQRGWAKKADVINTQPVEKMLKSLK